MTIQHALLFLNTVCIYHLSVCSWWLWGCPGNNGLSDILDGGTLESHWLPVPLSFLIFFIRDRFASKFLSGNKRYVLHPVFHGRTTVLALHIPLQTVTTMHFENIKSPTI